MAHEELIYQLTQAVYQRLGPATEPRVVEDLVTDIYKLLQPTPPAVSAPPPAGRSGRVVVSAFGVNRPGIVAALATSLAAAQYSIIDMNQTVVQGKFAMVLIAESAAEALDLAALKLQLREAGERVGVRVYAQREDLFQAMHRV